MTNTGDVTIYGIDINDSRDGTFDAAFPASLAPGEKWEANFTTTILPEDGENANVDNFIEVDAYALVEPEIPVVFLAQNGTTTDGKVKANVHAEISIECAFTPVRGLEIEKTSDAIDEIGLGETITYTFAVTNTGDVTLHDVAIDDTLNVDWEEAYPNGVIESIAPGTTIEVTATYVVTAADVENGYVYNCATASDGETTSNEDCVRNEVAQNPDLAISKVCPDPATVKRVGDSITYQVTVVNSGDVTIYDIVLTDVRDGEFGDYPTTLAPGATFTVDFTTTITAEDAANGNLDNTVTVTGTALIENDEAPAEDIPVVFFSQENGIDHSNGKTEVTVDETATITCPYVPATGLVIEKTSDKVAADDVVAGTKITYSFAVTNTGDTTLDDVVINDDLDGLVWDAAFADGMVGDLAPGATVIATATYIVTDADVDAGHVLNCAIATSGENESNESCVDVPTDGHPALAIIKTATPVKVTKAGEVITYTFVVTNTGNVPLKDVVVVDEMLDKAGVEIPAIGDLKPGETRTVTAKYTVTEADMKLDAICNTAVATDGETTSEPDTATVKVVHPKPAPKPAPAPTKLPNTGSGTDTSGQDGLWMIAATGAAILAAGALGLRKRTQM